MAYEQATISNFLHEKSVLIIGAKDVICETLTKKILKHCNVWHIYIIFHGSEADMEVSKNSFLENRDEKIIFINGNLSQHNLGLTYDQAALLRENVIAVYHTGLTDYKASLKKAVEINLVRTSQVLNFCRQIKRLQALIHVSIAFSCTEDPVLDEIVYQQPISPEVLMEYCNWMNDDQLRHVMKQFQVCLNGFVLTKTLSEELVASEKNDFPVSIVRPSIVLEMSNALMSFQKNVVVLDVEAPFKPMTTLSTDLISANNLASLLFSASWYLIAHSPEFPVIYHCTGNLNPLVKFKKTVSSSLFEKFTKNWPFSHSKIDPETLYRPYLKEFFRYENNNRIQLKKLMNDQDKSILSNDGKVIAFKYIEEKKNPSNYLLSLKKYDVLLKILIFLFWKRYILKSTPATHLLFASAVVLFGLIKAGSKGFKYIRRHF